jgi:hypothetical protein
MAEEEYDDEAEHVMTMSVNILYCAPGRGDTPTGEPVVLVHVARGDGDTEVLSLSLRDADYLLNGLKASIEHHGEQPVARGSESIAAEIVEEESLPPPTAVPSTETAPIRFVSDLKPTGLCIRAWQNGQLNVYYVLGGYALRTAGQYVLLCRTMRPKRDFLLRCVQDRDGVRTSFLPHDHWCALPLKKHLWRWFGNCGTRKPLSFNNEHAYFRKLSLTTLKKLVAKT